MITIENVKKHAEYFKHLILYTMEDVLDEAANLRPGRVSGSVQVWFLTELYKLFWKTDLASSLLEKDEEEKILKKKHLTLIGNSIITR